MRVPDAYRAQLFIGRLTAGLSDLESALLALGCTDEAIESTIADVASALAIDLDSMTLPVVALELAIAKELVAGYTRTYDLISGWLAQEGARLSCLNAAKACRPRMVVRSTAYYSQVLRRLEQPEDMVCRDAAETIVFWASEVYDLLRHDVPYFHHNPAECHLYHWRGSCEEENLFPVSAIDSLRESWRKRSPMRRDKNVDRIRETCTKPSI